MTIDNGRMAGFYLLIKIIYTTWKSRR